MRTIILSLFSRSRYLLASAAKRLDLVLEKEDSCDFQTIQELNENALHFVVYSSEEAGFMSQNRVKWSHFLPYKKVDSPNFLSVFKDWTPNLTFER